MEKRNIIVIGASAGGFEACRELVRALPSSIDASFFIVWHISPDVEGILPQILNRANSIRATNAQDWQEIETNRIYVAPPDHHLIIEGGYVRVTHGPKENRFRPAVDPLFRSAAYHYGNRVIGIILSGALDDGTSGLWTIKHYGGVAIVQSPAEAVVSSMPENAIRGVEVDYVAPVAEIAKILVQLIAEEVDETKNARPRDERTDIEIKIATEGKALQKGIMNYGQRSEFTCPECHGTLSSYTEGNRIRYRCHTGHAFSTDSLLATVTEKVEDNLYSALRAMEETILLLNNIGDHFADENDPKLAALYFKKATEAAERGSLVRQAIQKHERLSKDGLLKEGKENENKKLNTKDAVMPVSSQNENGIN